jgi:erythromycin esterase-like protein
LLALRGGLEFVDATRPAADWPDVAPAIAMREGAMVALARSVLVERHGAGVVLMGHAAHLARDSRSMHLLDTGAGPAADTLGSVLARDHPGRVLSIWLLHGSGEDSQPLRSLPTRYPLVRGTLNEALAELGDSFLLPLTTPGPLPELLRHEQEIRWIYGAGCRTRLTDQTDAIVFVRHAHPLAAPLEWGTAARE